jgi:hypothetical protein
MADTARYAWVMWIVIPLLVSQWRRHRRRNRGGSLKVS